MITSGETRAELPANKYEEYASALAAADANAPTDELDRYFKVSGSATLRVDDVLHLNRFKVARDGSLLVCDFERKVVLRFDPEGKDSTRGTTTNTSSSTLTESSPNASSLVATATYG
jgi:hypothetical protein